MKKTFIISALGAMLMASCADEFNTNNYPVDRPAESEAYLYLNDYMPLKEYAPNSNFKLGVGTTVSEYLKQELVYSLVNSNFTETEPGNAMKMASCVDPSTGAMNFGTVSEYVNLATDAGLSVYGHTLAWHAQQPVKWLNSLLADKPAPIPEGGANACIVYDCGDAGANPWDKQAHYKLPIPMEKGKTYVVKARVKADNGGDFGLWPIWDASPNRDQWGGSADVSYQASYPITSSFSDLEWTFEAPFPIDKLQFVFGKIGGKVYIDDLSCKEKGSDAEMVKNGSFDEDSMDGWGNNWNGPSFSIEGQAAGPTTFFVSLIDNGNMEGTEAHNFATKSDQGSIVYEIVDGVGKDGSRGAKITSKGGYSDAWESQFWIVSNEVLHIGHKIHVAFDYRADGGCAGTNVDTQAHFGPGEYQHWSCAGTVSFTGEWQTYDKTFTVDASMAKEDDKGMKSIAFNMSPNTAPGAYYIDNVVLEIEKEGDGIPLTPEEKKDTLTWAMGRWIQGMMEACDGKVKAWDVVNEAISGGGDDGEGNYPLQHGQEGDTENFYWQDYLGDIDYVRTAVRLARQYGPEDVKLFINDYNLESDWDQNKKLKSLINWIKKWEADGVTKIDGIGSQMHISCYANQQTQESKKAAIENMFRLMAQSGKLIRISELDMGYVDADGNSVKTGNMTEAQHQQMAELYTFVVSKYLEIIPASQQWGICQWCITDSPADSGWRKGEPTGLWDKNYYRKHTYAGFANGLIGK